MGMSASIVLAAGGPAGLARFYGALLEVEPQPGLSATHWRVPWFVVGWRSTTTPGRLQNMEDTPPEQKIVVS